MAGETNKKVDDDTTITAATASPASGNNNILMAPATQTSSPSLRRTSSLTSSPVAAATPVTDYSKLPVPRGVMLYFVFVLIFVFTLIQQSNTIFDHATDISDIITMDHPHPAAARQQRSTTPGATKTKTTTTTKSSKAIKTNKRSLEQQQQKQFQLDQPPPTGTRKNINIPRKEEDTTKNKRENKMLMGNEISEMLNLKLNSKRNNKIRRKDDKVVVRTEQKQKQPEEEAEPTDDHEQISSPNEEQATRKKKKRGMNKKINNPQKDTPPEMEETSATVVEEEREESKIKEQPEEESNSEVALSPPESSLKNVDQQEEEGENSQPVVTEKEAAAEAKNENGAAEVGDNTQEAEEEDGSIETNAGETNADPTTQNNIKAGEKDAKISGLGEKRQNEEETNNSDNNPTTTTTTPAYSRVDVKALDTLLDKIIAKWEIQDATNAKSLLRTIWYKDNSYDKERDLIVFTHPLKSGGTSVSNLLDALGDAVPGSHESGHFNKGRFSTWDAMDRQTAQKDGISWADSQGRRNLKSLYSHDGYRRYRQGGAAEGVTGGLVPLVENNFPNRRVRHIMMVREPLAFVASNFNEWFCNLAKLRKRSKEFKVDALPDEDNSEYIGCNGFTLEMLAQVRKARNEKECYGFTPENATAYDKDIRRRCRVARKNNWENQPECASIDTFLDSQSYLQHFHNHGAYARCTVPAANTTSATTTTTTTTTADYVEAAIEFLGGLDAPIGPHGDPNGDMMWHGITERMRESMCLLHHELKLPWQSTPTRRIQTCRPTKYWTEDHRTKFYAKEPMMLAVHKAANAVLDVQLAKMRVEVAHLQETLGPSANLTHVGEGCLDGDDDLALPTIIADTDIGEQAQSIQALEGDSDSNVSGPGEEGVPNKVEAEAAESGTTETKNTRRGRKKRQRQETNKQDHDNNNSPATRTASSQVNNKALNSMLDKIIAKWEIQDATNARTLLRKIWDKDNTYDKERDLIVFTHPLKTGGTSVSNLLDSMGNVVPGSHESGHFNQGRFRTWDSMDRFRAKQEGINWADSPRRRNMTSIYSHAGYRRYGQGTNVTGGLVNFVADNFPDRRVRHILMVREPLAFAASNFNEWKCKLVKMSKWAKEMKIAPLPEDSDYYGCNGYTVEMLAQARVAKFQKECKGFTKETAKTFEKETRKKCQAAMQNNGDPWPECSSIDRFLDSQSFVQHFHNSGSYGRCTVPATFGTTAAQYVEAAIEYLGGLDAPIVDGYAYGDMMWHGITERMKESMCLLHYELKLPWQSTPTRRIQTCRPTSYWTTDNRAKFYKKEPMMLAVHRAANAVLDVQLAKMRVEVFHLKRSLGPSANLTYVGEGCLEGEDHLELIKKIAAEVVGG